MTAKGQTSTNNRPGHWLAAALGLACIAILGCGPKGEYGATRGRVTCSGQPVTEGQVVFFEPECRVYQAARLQSDGSYVAKMSEGPGLLVGTYQVAVMPPVIEGPGSKTRGPRTPKEFRNIPFRYRNPKTSGLTLTVVEGDNPPFDIDMKP
jgi:hypothetical protein